MPTVKEDAATGRKVYVEWIDGCPVMVNILSIDGVLPEEYKEFLAPTNVVVNLRKMSPPNATFNHIDTDGGHVCLHNRIVPNIPFVSPRTFITTLY